MHRPPLSPSTRRALRRALALALTLALAGPLGLVADGCDAAADDATTGARVTLATRAVADPASLSTFTTGFGWKVTLEAAAVSIAALYVFDGPPAFDGTLARAPRPLGPLLGVREAHAHPGHYQAGDALAQMLTPTSVDALAPSSDLPSATGITGDYRSARVVLGAKPTGPAASALGGHVAVARGTAVRADGSTKDRIHFALSADFADVAKSVPNGEVSGCAFAEAKVEGDGVITIALHPAVWLDFVDFSGVAPGTAEAPTEVPHGDVAQVGFALGIVQLRAYSLSYAKGGS